MLHYMNFAEWSEVARDVVTVPALAIGGTFAIMTWVLHRRRVEIEQRRADDARYVSALERLGNPNKGVQVGAIVDLGQMALESESRHEPIMKVLCAQVREQAPWPPVAAAADGDEARSSFGPGEAAPAALVAIGRSIERHRKRGQGIDLSRTDLRNVDLREGAFNGVVFSESNLSGAMLREANLIGANLYKAESREAYLVKAHLRAAYLSEASLEGAYLQEASLERAYLVDANLRGAYLQEASLEGASLVGADLREANLEAASLAGARLDEAHLEGARFRGDPRALGATWEEGCPPKDLEKIVIADASDP